MQYKKILVHICLILLISAGLGVVNNYLIVSKPLDIFSPYELKIKEVSERDFPAVDIDTLDILLQNDNVILLDARDKIDYDFSHIPKAINLPVRDFENKFSEIINFFDLANAENIVVYCSSLTCPDALMLATKLEKRGIKNVMIFKEGIMGWQQANKDTEPKND